MGTNKKPASATGKTRRLDDEADAINKWPSAPALPMGNGQTPQATVPPAFLASVTAPTKSASELTRTALYMEALRAQASKVATLVFIGIVSVVMFITALSGAMNVAVVLGMLTVIAMTGRGIHGAITGCVTAMAQVNVGVRLVFLGAVTTVLLCSTGALWELAVSFSLIGLIAEAVLRDVTSKAVAKVKTASPAVCANGNGAFDF